jgi:hypothetical protein
MIKVFNEGVESQGSYRGIKKAESGFKAVDYVQGQGADSV